MVDRAWRWTLAAGGLALVGFFFSYRLLEVPTGFTIDEGAFGYNAVLLARDGHDQNGWFMPVFVLSIEGRDWRQPVPQYFMALFFKIFGAKVFNLRLTSVVITLVSTVLIFVLGRQLLGKVGAILVTAVFLMTPQVMMQSHLALDNITPMPFALGWLMGLFLFWKRGSLWGLVLAALSLGFGFYSYKGMEPIVPVWVALTLVFVAAKALRERGLVRRWRWRPMLVFVLVTAPFFLIIPNLQRQYPCSVFNCQRVTVDNIYDFLYPYLSSYDPSFLFIKGDLTYYHSTGRYGMLLLASFPLFILGFWQALKRRGFWLLILAAFLTAPFFYGLVNSVYRASRLMAMIPSYSLLAGLGAYALWERRRELFPRVGLAVLMTAVALNYFDFVRDYWFDYAKLTENQFGHLKAYVAYEELAKVAMSRGLRPYIEQDLAGGDGENGHFFEAVYFEKPLLKSLPGEAPPPGSSLLSHRRDIPGMTYLETPFPDYNLLIN